MLPENIRAFTSENHQGVLTCFRRNGAAQVSIVTCGTYQDGVAFTTTEDRAKLHNLRRDPPVLPAGVPRGLAPLRSAGGLGPNLVSRKHRRG